MKKYFFWITAVLIALAMQPDSAFAQQKGKGKGKKAKAQKTDKKKGMDGKADVELGKIDIQYKLETPRVVFKPDRLAPDVKVDYSRFGDISEEVAEDARRVMYRNKVNEKPLEVAAPDITARKRIEN
jgi:hypothetical protein